jgi:hypothetical protein
MTQDKTVPHSNRYSYCQRRTHLGLACAYAGLWLPRGQPYLNVLGAADARRENGIQTVSSSVPKSRTTAASAAAG